jgi:hypothetical protein
MCSSMGDLSIVYAELIKLPAEHLTTSIMTCSLVDLLIDFILFSYYYLVILFIL